MIDFLLFIWLVALSVRMGSIFKSWLQLRLSMLEGFIFSFAIGISICSYFTFLLGICGLFFKWFFWSLFIIVSVIFLALDYKKVSSFRNYINFASFREQPFLKFLLLLYGLTILVGVFAPVTAWDAVLYHFAIPKLYLQQHRIFDVWHSMFSNLPFFMEMLYTMGFLLKGEILAGLFHFAMGVVTAMALYAFGRRFFSKEIGLLAAVIFYTMPLQTSLASFAFNDLGLAFFSFLAVYFLFFWIDNIQKVNCLIASAIFGGIGCAIKYFGLIVVFLLSLTVILQSKGKAVIKNFLIFFTVVALVASPWYLKNIIYTGNPIFPFFYSFFRYFARQIPENLQGPLAVFTHPNSFRGIKDYILFPLILVFSFHRNGGWRFSPGPLHLLLIPLLLFVRGVDRKIKYLFWYSTAYLVIVVFRDVMWNRYLIPIFPALCLVAAYGLMEFSKRGPLVKRIFIIILYVSFILNLGLIFIQHLIRFPVVLGLETREQFLSQRISSYPVIRYINKNLSDKELILVFDDQLYYYNRRYIWGDPRFNPYLNYDKIKNPEEFLRWMKNKGVTYMLVNYGYEEDETSNPSVMVFYKPMLKLRRGLTERHLKLVYQEGATYLFKVTY